MFASRHVQIVVLSLGLILATSACRREKASSGLPGDDEIVARVNGKDITRYDVELQGKHSLGQLSVGSIERVAYPKLVEATIQTRAIALAAEKELTPTERQALEKEVAAHREQLLVRRYLKRHSPPKPVTPEMALDYYKQHPERFGASKQKTYQLIGTTRALAGSERAALLRDLEGAAAQSDWKLWAESLAKRGHAVAYSEATAGDRLLHPKLRELLSGLKPGQVAAPAFIQGRAYLARVGGEAEQPPRPFDEVREDIERLLGPSQVSAAVERVAREVMKATRVELVNAPKPAEPHPLASGRKP
jgi:hypothetical protein